MKKAKKIKLPKPGNEYGYSYEEIIKFMSKKELTEFDKWMFGQTCGLDDNHQPIYYTWDVERFLNLIRNKVPTFWD